MAWTTPRTWVAGEVVTAAVMNTHVRDNLKALGDSPTTFVPVVAGVATSGNSGRWRDINGEIIVDFAITMSGAPTGTVTMGLPIAANGFFGFGQINVRGVVSGRTAAAAVATGKVRLASSTAVAFISDGSGSNDWGTGIPIVWGAGTQWGGRFTFEKA
jgi:hypothetical protein